MKRYDFDLVLSAPATEAQDELLFESFDGAVTPSVLSGVGYLSVHVHAATMEDAIQGAVERVQAVGYASSE
jgi:hypothetical protein